MINKKIKQIKFAITLQVAIFIIIIALVISTYYVFFYLNKDSELDKGHFMSEIYLLKNQSSILTDNLLNYLEISAFTEDQDLKLITQQNIEKLAELLKKETVGINDVSISIKPNLQKYEIGPNSNKYLSSWELTINAKAVTDDILLGYFLSFRTNFPVFSQYKHLVMNRIKNLTAEDVDKIDLDHLPNHIEGSLTIEYFQVF